MENFAEIHLTTALPVRPCRSLNPAEAPVACELRATRYDLIMKGFGGDGETIDSLDQVQPAIERALSSTAPYCVNVSIRGIRSPFTDWQIGGKKSSA